MDQSSQKDAHQAYTQQVSVHCIQMASSSWLSKEPVKKIARFKFAAIDDANRVDAR